MFATLINPLTEAPTQSNQIITKLKIKKGIQKPMHTFYKQSLYIFKTREVLTM